MSRAMLLAGGLVLLAACQVTETPEEMQNRLRTESQVARSEIEAVNLRLSDWVRAGQADSVATVYAPLARMHGEGEPTIEGRDAIRAKYAEYFTMGSWDWAGTTLGVTAYGPMAVEHGTYVLNLVSASPNAPPGMAAMFPDSGKYVIYWHKVDGHWLIMDDIAVTSRNRQPQPAQPARRQ